MHPGTYCSVPHRVLLQTHLWQDNIHLLRIQPPDRLCIKASICAAEKANARPSNQSSQRSSPSSSRKRLPLDEEGARALRSATRPPASPPKQVCTLCHVDFDSAPWIKPRKDLECCSWLRIMCLSGQKILKVACDITRAAAYRLYFWLVGLLVGCMAGCCTSRRYAAQASELLAVQRRHRRRRAWCSSSNSGAERGPLEPLEALS